MQEELEIIFSLYREEKTRTVDLSKQSSKLLISTLPAQLRHFLEASADNYSDLIVKGSIGQGNRTDYPWISILNSNITSTTQEGLYLAFLFPQNMRGVYLALMQGITSFERKYGRNKYKNVRKTVQYFREELNLQGDIIQRINLHARPGSLAYGYEETTICAYFFPQGHFTENDLQNHLLQMLKLYHFIYQHMQGQTYDQVIDNILNDSPYEDIETAIKNIRDTLNQEKIVQHGFHRVLLEEIPYARVSKKLMRISAPQVRKIDYLKKAKEQAITGLDGELLALEYEKKRLCERGLDNYVERIKHVSLNTDNLGYDIQSFDHDKNGHVYEIYIEVKTTSSQVDIDFYVSCNEVDVSREKNSQYWLYRIYDCNNLTPKFYRAQGAITANFILDPVTYLARYKYPRSAVNSLLPNMN